MKTESEAPTFLLVGHDAAAPLAIEHWAMVRKLIRPDEIASVGEAFRIAKDFRTYHADFIRRNPQKQREYPLDIVVQLSIQQQMLEDYIGINEHQAGHLQFDVTKLMDAKRVLHRLYIDAVRINQNRGRG